MPNRPRRVKQSKEINLITSIDIVRGAAKKGGARRRQFVLTFAETHNKPADWWLRGLCRRQTFTTNSFSAHWIFCRDDESEK